MTLDDSKAHMMIDKWGNGALSQHLSSRSISTFLAQSPTTRSSFQAMSSYQSRANIAYHHFGLVSIQHSFILRRQLSGWHLAATFLDHKYFVAMEYVKWALSYQLRCFELRTRIRCPLLAVRLGELLSCWSPSFRKAWIISSKLKWTELSDMLLLQQLSPGKVRWRKKESWITD